MEVLGEKPHGLSRKTVSLMQYHRNPKASGREHRRNTGITSRREENVRALLLKKGAATQKGERIPGILDAPGPGFQQRPFPSFLRGTLGGTCSGKNERERMSACTEEICHCQRWMNVATGATAGYCNRLLHFTILPKAVSIEQEHMQPKEQIGDTMCKDGSP